MAFFDTLLRSNGMLAYDVIMLQETHHASDDEILSWLRCGAGRGRQVSAHHFHAVGSTASAGVVTLFASHLHVSDFAVKAAVDGRLLAISCHIFNTPFCFVNVYAPHEPNARIDFFTSTMATYLPDAFSLSNTTCLWGGDWNCIADVHLDQSCRSIPRERGFHDAFAPVLSTHSMHDAFRHLHPTSRQFSFARVPSTGAATYSRLDRWYVSESALPLIHAASYTDSLPTLGVDHRATTLSLDLPRAPCWGPGVWSFPLHLLWDDTCLQRIRRSVELWLEQHPCGSDGTALARWLELKLHIKHQAILIGMRQKKRQMHTQHIAQRTVAVAASRWAAHPSDTALADAYHVASTAASTDKVEAARKAAKLASVAWEDYGEKCTAWFHRHGRQRKQATVINSVRAPDAQQHSIDLSTPANIVEAGHVIADFFDSDVQGALFYPGNTDVAAQQDLLGALDRALSESDSAACEEQLTLGELTKALSACATSKRPGLDGIPYEVYSALWEYVGPCLIGAWDECMSTENPALPAQMLEGCVVLLYKGAGSREDLSNYRPITLLNADYKLIAKAYAQRFGGPAATVVDETQTAFIPGRWIGDNVLHHLEEVDYCDAVGQPACILFLDFAKAYDKMDRGWLLQCMDHMGFGPKALAVVRCLLQGTRARCLFNGHLTRSFEVTSGVAQGSPLSPLLYVLAAQPLAAKIRQLQQQGIYEPVQQPDGQPAPGSHQHADDTTLHAKSAEDAERIVEHAVEPFCRAANAKLNAAKTKVLLIGGAEPPTTPPKSGIVYPTSEHDVVAVRHLGIMLAPGYTGASARQAKFDSIAGAMRSRMLHWSHLSLTVLGRAHVAKQCLASMFIHHATFSYPSLTLLTQLESTVARFVHDGAFHPSRQIAQLPRSQGGIALVSVQAATEALQAKVACKYLTGDRRSWHVYWDYWLGKISAAQPRIVDYLQYGPRLLCMAVKLRNISPHIPARILDHVKALRACGIAREHTPQDGDTVAAEPVFYNLHRSTSSLQGFLQPSQFPHLVSASVRIVADLHRLHLVCQQLHEALRMEVCTAYACIPTEWQQLLPQHPIIGASLSFPIQHFTVGGTPFAESTVRSLTQACLQMRFSIKHPNLCLPVRPSLWPEDQSPLHPISRLEQQWVEVCEQGPRASRGVVRVRDEHIGESVRVGAAWIDDGHRHKRQRPAPRDRNASTPATTAEGPLSLQHSRAPSAMGPQTATHTSWWCKLTVSNSSTTQPSLQPWGSCWQSLWGRGLTREVVWVLWSLAHGALPCGARQRYLAIKARSNDVPHGRCMQPECQDTWDTLQHGILHCPRVQQVWGWVARLWVAIAGGAPPPLTAEIILCGTACPTWRPRLSLWYLLRAVALSCILKARGKSHLSGQPLSAARVSCCIVNALRETMRSDWIAATRCHAVRAMFGTPAASAESLKRRFKKRWAHGGVLCSVADDESAMHIRLTPQFPVAIPSSVS